MPPWHAISRKVVAHYPLSPNVGGFIGDLQEVVNWLRLMRHVEVRQIEGDAPGPDSLS